GILQNPPSAAISTSSTIDRRRRILKGGVVGEDKGNGLAGLRELADRFEIFALEADLGSQKKTLWTGNRVDRERGRHSQSIEPSRPTRAAVLQSPIRA